MREFAINIISLYIKAKTSRKYRFPAEMVSAVAKKAGTSVSMVKLVLNNNGFSA